MAALCHSVVSLAGRLALHPCGADLQMRALHLKAICSAILYRYIRQIIHWSHGFLPLHTLSTSQLPTKLVFETRPFHLDHRSPDPSWIVF